VGSEPNLRFIRVEERHNSYFTLLCQDGVYRELRDLGNHKLQCIIDLQKNIDNLIAIWKDSKSDSNIYHKSRVEDLLQSFGDYILDNARVYNLEKPLSKGKAKKWLNKEL
jgi:hypothetical protein